MNRNFFKAFTLAAVTIPVACAQSPRTEPPVQSTDSRASFLYVWSASADTMRRAAFLSVVDVRLGSPTAGAVIRTLWAGQGSRGTHHTEHQLESDNLLFANDFGAGRTYILDLSDPAVPRIRASFSTAGPFGWPHSYVRLANGNRLATYQWQSSKWNLPPGGIAEVATDGKIVRWAKAATGRDIDNQVTPYSLAVLADADRIVTTSTSMMDDAGVHVQIWRLSDFALLHTLEIPAAGPSAHAQHSDSASKTVPHHRLPGEPRVLADGKTVMFGTFNCGLYSLTGVGSLAPQLEQVYTFPGADCAVPVVIGSYWLQTVPALRAVIVLDVSTHDAPREVSRVTLPSGVKPHWLAADESKQQLVTSSASRDDPDLHLLRFDSRNGNLSVDSLMPVVRFRQVAVEGLGLVPAVPHGAVFSRH